MESCQKESLQSLMLPASHPWSTFETFNNLINIVYIYICFKNAIPCDLLFLQNFIPFTISKERCGDGGTSKESIDQLCICFDDVQSVCLNAFCLFSQANSRKPWRKKPARHHELQVSLTTTSTNPLPTWLFPRSTEHEVVWLMHSLVPAFMNGVNRWVPIYV
jgi:hypothetical protein